MNRGQIKKGLIVAHDLMATATALVLALALRLEAAPLVERLWQAAPFLPFFVLGAGALYRVFSLYQARWRFASLPDLYNIFRAVTVLALLLLVVDYVLVSPDLRGNYFFGKITIALYWLLQMAFLGGPRLAFRYWKYARSRHGVIRDGASPTLLLGRASDIEVVLRAIESGAIRKLSPKGILSPREADQGQSIRGVPVLGQFQDLEQVVRDFSERGIMIRRLVATPTALLPESLPERLIAASRHLGLPLSRLASLGEGVRDTQLAPLEIEDLLLRPTVTVDTARLERFIRGKKVLVTGGGGSIGSEICMRVAGLSASALLIVENSEPALHHVLERPGLCDGAIRVEGVLADIRDRERMHQLMLSFRPDLVFHAAALKHVPYLEKDWMEGIRTNVFGSAHVAEAAMESGTEVCVMISTDKAIEPVSMLGATKRLAEMTMQAFDAESSESEGRTRFIGVRFGNVLGSNGSVVPKFKTQIARGGPVTVTSPDMVRYFMTVGEACDLVLTAASHADGEGRKITALRPGDRASIYVLKMGQPVRIHDLAARMIRLAGFEPGEDIEIQVTGSRPGERLHEILFARDEPVIETGIEGVMAAKPVFANRVRVAGWLKALEKALVQADRILAEQVLEDAIPDFRKRDNRLVASDVSSSPAMPRRPVLVHGAASQGS
jgi:FlaA1/EpsC-like NDP-sugar epimerase